MLANHALPGLVGQPLRGGCGKWDGAGGLEDRTVAAPCSGDPSKAVIFLSGTGQTTSQRETLALSPPLTRCKELTDGSTAKAARAVSRGSHSLCADARSCACQWGTRSVSKRDCVWQAHPPACWRPLHLPRPRAL